MQKAFLAYYYKDVAGTPDTRPVLQDPSIVTPIQPEIFQPQIPDVLEPTSEPVTVYSYEVPIGPNYWLVQERRSRRLTSAIRR